MECLGSPLCLRKRSRTPGACLGLVNTLLRGCVRVRASWAGAGQMVKLNHARRLAGKSYACRLFPQEQAGVVRFHGEM